MVNYRLTANNADLSKRLTRAMDETLEYTRKAETLQKEKDKNEKYVHVGKTLAKIAPNTYRGITYGMGSVGLFFADCSLRTVLFGVCRFLHAFRSKPNTAVAEN